MSSEPLRETTIMLGCGEMMGDREDFSAGAGSNRVVQATLTFQKHSRHKV